MTSLLDVGDLTEDVPVGAAVVTVYPVTPEGFFYLLSRFPMLKSLFTRGSAGLTMEDLQDAAPECISHVLAVATTDRGACATQKAWYAEISKAAKIAVRLSASHQSALFGAAVRLTFPDGIGPFMKSMAELTTTIGRISGQAMDPATKSSKPSRSGFSSDSVGRMLGRGALSASSRH